MCLPCPANLHYWLPQDETMRVTWKGTYPHSCFQTNTSYITKRETDGNKTENSSTHHSQRPTKENRSLKNKQPFSSLWLYTAIQHFNSCRIDKAQALNIPFYQCYRWERKNCYKLTKNSSKNTKTLFSYYVQKHACRLRSDLWFDSAKGVNIYPRKFVFTVFSEEKRKDTRFLSITPCCVSFHFHFVTTQTLPKIEDPNTAVK